MINVLEVLRMLEALADYSDIFGSEEHNITVIAETKPTSFNFLMDQIINSLYILRAILGIAENTSYTDAERVSKISKILDRENIIAGTSINDDRGISMEDFEEAYNVLTERS